MLYANAEDVIQFTGVTPDDLQLESSVELISLVEKWVEQATSLIEQDRNRVYDPVPAGIENICIRMTANMVGYAVQRRNTTTVTHDDYDTRLIEDKMMTPSTKSDLRRWPRKHSMRFFVPKMGVDDGS